jgi:DNA invertase Pin-like site-specific DNA recombinase
MKTRVALYLRVSTDDQTVANQRRELEAVAKRSGWKIVATFQDRGISGAKGRDRRPAFDNLCKGVTRRDFDLVAAWSVDRLGRSLRDLVGFLEELRSKGVDLYLHQQALDTSTPAGRAMFGMMGVFAEFERAMIVARVKAGLARARQEGKRLGRPGIGADVERQIIERRARGMGMLKIARELGIGTSAVQRVVAAQ